YDVSILTKVPPLTRGSTAGYGPSAPRTGPQDDTRTAKTHCIRPNGYDISRLQRESIIMLQRLIIAAACALFVRPFCLPASAQASPPAQEDPAHNELRALKKQLTDAVNANDLDALLAVLDEKVVVTWQNAEVSRGPQQVREYYDRMMKGDKRIVQSI